jgi:hypothetical protein
MNADTSNNAITIAIELKGIKGKALNVLKGRNIV